MKPQTYWYHEDDNYSPSAADQHNIDSGYGETKYKIKTYVSRHAYDNLEKILREFYESVLVETGGPLPWPELTAVDSFLNDSSLTGI